MGERIERIQVAGSVVENGEELDIVREYRLQRGGETVPRIRRIRAKFESAQDGIARMWTPAPSEWLKKGTEQRSGYRYAHVIQTEVNYHGLEYTEWLEFADRQRADPDRGDGLVATIRNGEWLEQYDLDEDTVQAMGADGTRLVELRDRVISAATDRDVDDIDAIELADQFIEHYRYCDETYLSI